MSRGLPYYEEAEFQEYLLSRERLELFPVEKILGQLQWGGIENFLDFGAGNGFFIPFFYQYRPAGCHIWAAECQEELLDQLLQQRVKQDWPDFSAFFVERTEHPLLPDWIPPMDMIFCSLSLSTFANPALALLGLRRSLSDSGRIIVLDWEKISAPSGPEESLKVSRTRMEYFFGDAGFKVQRNFKINKYLYSYELIPDAEAVVSRGYEQTT